MTENSVIEQVRSIVEIRVNPCDPDYETATVTVSALFVGPNIDAIVDLTGLARDFVEGISSRMRASGLWTDACLDYDDWFSDDVTRRYSVYVYCRGRDRGVGTFA